MIKRILSILAMAVLFVLLALAEPAPADQTVTQASSDSVVINLNAGSVNASESSVAISCANNATTGIVELDNQKFLIHNGKSYNIDELTEISDRESSESFDREMRRNRFFYNRDFERTAFFTITLFIVPCILIVLIIILVLRFLQRKSHERNQVVMHAIDSGYPLPDAFYVNPSASSQIKEEFISSTNANAKSEELKRDPKKFTSAVTLLAIGIGILVFFQSTGHGAASALGLIPILLGVGKLIGFFFVKGFASENPTGYRTRGTNNYPPYGPGNNGYGSHMHNNGGFGCPPPPPGNPDSENRNQNPYS